MVSCNVSKNRPLLQTPHDLNINWRPGQGTPVELRCAMHAQKTLDYWQDRFF